MSERAGFYERTLRRLLAAGFEDVTISNIDESGADDAYAPYAWSYADAEALPFDDGSFDWTVVSAGLHHCASPHRALLELYRSARRGLLAIESRDSLLMRLALWARAVDPYELTAVVANGFASGGVRNTAVPNYVYRWTERELEKTIASNAPHARHRFRYFREFELPASLLEMRRNPLWSAAGRVAEPVAAAITRVAPSQANLFAFAVLKPELPRDLQPWLREVDGTVVPDEAWLRKRLRG